MKDTDASVLKLFFPTEMNRSRLAKAIIGILVGLIVLNLKLKKRTRRRTRCKACHLTSGKSSDRHLLRELQENNPDDPPSQELDNNEDVIASTPVGPRHKAKKRRNLSDATSSSLLKATSALQQKPDDCDGFDLLTANRLGKMSDEQRNLAESLVLEVLHKGVNGQLSATIHLSDSQVLTPHLSIPIPYHSNPMPSL